MDSIKEQRRKLQDFFSVKGNWDLFAAIKQRKDVISLRLIEFFITNYCIINDVLYGLVHDNGINTKIDFTTNEGGKGIGIGPEIKSINVRQSYLLQISLLHKRNFDPCCRRGKYLMNGIITNDAQLAFFKWAIENRVIDWLRENIDVVKRGMRQEEYEKKQARTLHEGKEFRPRKDTLSRKRFKAKHNFSVMHIIQNVDESW
jgi:hypothetical protein